MCSLQKQTQVYSPPKTKKEWHQSCSLQTNLICIQINRYIVHVFTILSSDVFSPMDSHRLDRQFHVNFLLISVFLIRKRCLHPGFIWILGTTYLQEWFNFVMQQRITIGGMFSEYLIMARQFWLIRLSNLWISGWVYKVTIFDVLNFLKVLIFCQPYCHKNLTYKSKFKKTIQKNMLGDEIKSQKTRPKTSLILLKMASSTQRQFKSRIIPP